MSAGDDAMSEPWWASGRSSDDAPSGPWWASGRSSDDAPSGPWWASGGSSDDGLDGAEDPFTAHRRARSGATDSGAPDPDAGRDETGRDEADPPGEAARLVSDAVDLVARLATQAGRRMAARAAANAAGATGERRARTAADGAAAGEDPDTRAAWSRLADGLAPHEDGRVCDACPVCIGLRALRQVRPEVVAHLSDAAHHVSLALRALAEAQGGEPEGLEKIDLDP